MFTSDMLWVLSSDAASGTIEPDEYVSKGVSSPNTPTYIRNRADFPPGLERS